VIFHDITSCLRHDFSQFFSIINFSLLSFGLAHWIEIMKKVTEWIKQHSVIVFFIFAFAISWTIWISVRLFLAQKGVFHPFYFVGVFGPFLSAVIVTGIAERWSGLRQWFHKTFNFRINIGWYLIVGLLGPIGVALFQLGLYLFLGGEPDFSKAYPWWKYFIIVPITALFAGGNEEPGWRGFALPQLLKRQSPLVASLFLGLMWAIWHIPECFECLSDQIN